MIVLNMPRKIMSEEWFNDLIFDFSLIEDGVFFAAHRLSEKDGNTIIISNSYIKFDSEYYQVDEEGITKIKDDDELFTGKLFYTELAEEVTQDDFIDFKQKYREEVYCRVKQESNIDTSRDEEIFSAHGIKYKPLIGAARFMDRACSIDYDGVQYTIEIYEKDHNSVKKEIAEKLSRFEQLKCRYHDIIKNAYQFLKLQEELGDIWVLVGGGQQIQAFFGNKNGYIGILYLGMLDEIENAKSKSKKFTLEANFKNNNKYFKNFSHPLVSFRKSKSDRN